ncbi:hypothetical protein [Streptacidiphilus cavernicola]|uniref:NlpC/P60 domain-containing protein n=1 Tax=Streptacidiphilus cavernicola TaxID=3342716 RepID=A0ABV6W5B1_9ACTN
MPSSLPSSRNRRLLATLAATALTAPLLAVTLAASPASASTVNGPISANEILSRAQSWVDEAVPYNQGASHTDANGTYREDCSGFVSMAWHLDQSLIVTTGGPYFTTADGKGNPAYDTPVGPVGDLTGLQPGDAVAYPGEHIFLFAGWTNKAAGDFTYYAETNTSIPSHGPTAGNIHNATIEGLPTSGYVGLRSKNITSAIPAGFNVAIDADGAAASGKTVSGTVNLTGLASASGYINTGRYVITGPGNYNSGQLTPSAGGASNYPYAWNTAGLAGGTYQISFVASEIDGQDHTYGPVSVTVPAMPRSSSSNLAGTPDGGYATDWRGGDGRLWVGTGSGTTMAQPAEPWLLGVAEGTKPSIATLADGSWVTAWVGGDGKLWVGTGNGTTMAQPAEPWLLGVAPGTSPSIVALANGGWEVAWKGGDGKLWLGTGNGTTMAQPAEPWLLGVADTTSPSLAALPNGGYEVAWKGGDGKLWLGTGNGTTMAQPAEPWLLGVDTAGSSSSPSLATLPNGGYEVAWKGGDGRLWLGTGNGTTMAQPAEPWLLGVA